MHRRSMTSRSALPVAALLGVAMLLAPGGATAEGWREAFTDVQDGRFDASRWLLERRGLLPVPLVITEPAVGYGGGIALAYFRRNAPSTESTTEANRLAPPSITGLMAAGTENGTRFAALGHLGIWREDRLRYTGGVAALDVNLDFFGAGELPRLEDGIAYNLNGWGTFQQLIARVGTSHVWLGGQLLYLDAEAALASVDAPPVFDGLNGDVDNLGVGAVIQYDSRDNILTPGRGIQSEWQVRTHHGSFNGDFDYTSIDGKNRFYFQPRQRWVVGWRLDASYASSEAPFYALPSIIQRGVPRGRYQGEVVVATEVESRYDFDGRWFGVLFAGVGRAADSTGGLGDAEDRWAGGTGARYLIARALGLQAGIDVARGPEEWAFYLQVGSGWSF